jgi:poly(3-hydroxybutyrate) depolymerase
MTTTPTLPLRLTLLAVLGLAAGPGELKLKATDHKKFGELVSTYFNAMDEQKDIQAKLQDVLDQIEATEKRLKNPKLLASVEDWEEVFRLVTADRLKGDLKTKKNEVASIKTKHPNGFDVQFSYFIPKAYDPRKGGPMPLVLTVPDAGEDPTAHLNTHFSDAALRAGAILIAVQMGTDTSVWGTFGSKDAPGGVISVMNALGIASREFALDLNRVFLAGAGQGYAAAEATAASYPHLFAGLIGLGDVTSANGANLGNFRNTPTLLVQGKDGAKAIEAKIGELGFGNCTALPEGGPADLWPWVGKNKRTAYPAQITFSPVSDYAKRAHWISLEGLQVSENPRVEAKADRETNTITVDAQKVADIIIYLNDSLVDMDKPVRFVINGSAQEQTVPATRPRW